VDAALADLRRLLGPTGATAAPELAARELDEARWTDVLRLAEAWELTPVLAAVAVRAGVIPEAATLPPGLADRVAPTSPHGVLLMARAAAITRTADLLAQGRAVLDALRFAGVRAVPLKGLHLLLAGVWPDPAARSMRDLDVLVHPDHASRARSTLADLGYRPLETRGSRRPHHHLVPMALSGRPGTVELHTAPLPRRWDGLLPATDVFQRAAETGRLADVDVLVHVVAHAQLADHGRWLVTAPARAALDAAFLVRRCPALVDVVPQSPVLQRALTRHWRDAAFLTGAGEEGGRRWEAAAWLARRPAARLWYWRLYGSPRALAGDRMRELYGDDAPLWRTRARHAARVLSNR